MLLRPGDDAPAVPAPPIGSLPAGPGPRYPIGHAVRGRSVEWFTTWRMGLAAGIAGIISQGAGVGHPYWAILTSTIVINQWTARVAATRRAAHRTAGTLLSVGVVRAVAGLAP